MSFTELNITPTLIPPETFYTVTELNGEARALLENHFNSVWVMGEISNLSRPSSGHFYFSLKDKQTQIRCALFRAHTRTFNFTPENGQHVFLRGQISLYEARGDFQLIVKQMQLMGSGALQLAFEKLKEKLLLEGLFDPQYKKPIPKSPKKIGIITSATGAALQDILKVLRRCAAHIPILVYPSLVQGELAANQIVAMIEIANAEKNPCDILILARGGGSLEDLWSFNEEKVARAIFHSQIPMITGIGHEVDFTIADFVADLRAPTPSVAAELACANIEEWLQQLTVIDKRLKQSLHQQHYLLQQQLLHLSKRLKHPKDRLQQKTQQLDYLEKNFFQFFYQFIKNKTTTIHQLNLRLLNKNPKNLLTSSRTQLDFLSQQLYVQQTNFIQQSHQQLKALTIALDMASPLKTLQRGYSILTDERTHKIVREAKEIKTGDRLKATLASGEITVVVDDIDLI